MASLAQGHDIDMAKVGKHLEALLLRNYGTAGDGLLESDRRRGILDGGLLARVHVFRRRLPMMHRVGWEGRKSNSGMAFAWFIWELGHKGPTELHRLSWDVP